LYKLHKIGKTFFIKTDHKSDEDLLTQMASNCRYSVKKAIRFNLVFRELALNKENLSIFKTLYDATMKRDNASKFYFFNDSFYLKLLKFNSKNLRLFMIIYDNQAISCALVLVKNHTAHYFLSGSDLAYLNLSPNNFLLFSISTELAKEGIKVFHLGGGVGGLEDGLYKFKKSFNPSGELDFYLGTKIYNKDLYNHLSRNLPGDGKFFFPLYRK
jgi:lipid II:glycine glycyltransferase (peptidoglycan interpeptide bridge formation enzyme)